MSESAAAPALSVDNLSIRYGKTRILDDVSFEVTPGTVFALLGRNGVGKTSLVHCLLGHQKPTQGQARLFGLSAWSSRTRAMERVGVVPEEPDAPPAMSASELLRFCRRLYPRWDDEAVATRLARTAVPLDVPFGKLSKGQKGAVMLALALGHGPELLVLDDPALGLDALARRILYDEIIGELADRGTTVFLTSHDLEGVERLAGRVAIVKGRRLVVDEARDDLKARFRCFRIPGRSAEGLTWEPLEAVQVLRRSWGSEAIVSNFTDERLQAFHTRSGVSELEVLGLSLEEIFVALVGNEEVRP
jgi:ABC-2 type transport system ATP-binding protein